MWLYLIYSLTFFVTVSLDCSLSNRILYTVFFVTASLNVSAKKMTLLNLYVNDIRCRSLQFSLALFIYIIIFIFVLSNFFDQLWVFRIYYNMIYILTSIVLVAHEFISRIYVYFFLFKLSLPVHLGRLYVWSSQRSVVAMDEQLRSDLQNLLSNLQNNPVLTHNLRTVLGGLVQGE